MRDLATALTTFFPIVDDTMKGSAVIQHALKRPGPAPRHSDSELITIALYQAIVDDYQQAFDGNAPVCCGNRPWRHLGCHSIWVHLMI